jgi:hypothetical protein
MSKDTKGASKMDTIQRLMLRPKGASVNELTTATGWIPHSLTGAISRSRKSGLTITKTADPRRGPVYHAERAAA